MGILILVLLNNSNPHDTFLEAFALKKVKDPLLWIVLLQTPGRPIFVATLCLGSGGFNPPAGCAVYMSCSTEGSMVSCSFHRCDYSSLGYWCPLQQRLVKLRQSMLAWAGVGRSGGMEQLSW